MDPSEPTTNRALSLRGDRRPATPLRPSVVLAGSRLVVVGGTGFLGKVWVSLLLQRFPDVGHLYLVVRSKGEQTSEERLWAEIVPSPVFDPLRELYPGTAFERFIADKVTAVDGDVAEPLLGFAPDLVRELTGNVAAVVNVAGVVDFDPPLDEALRVNAFGVNNLIALARALDAPVMHTSTCYVAGYRTGMIHEADPRDVPFPRAEGAPGARLIAPPEGYPLDRKLHRSHWNPQNEIDECLDVIEHTRHRCEDAFRQSLFFDEAKRNLAERGEPARGGVLEDELAEVKRKFTRERLVEAGRERALYWGWPNIYTYTKSIGEQVLAASGLRYTIVRPAVIESASVYPFPGWNEGINTSAPYIYLALKGQMQFPSDRDVHLDLIPVDMVASAMIAALAELVEGDPHPVYQFGTTDTNACKVSRFIELIGLYKRKKLQDGGDEGNRLLNVVMARLEPVSLSKKRYNAHGPHAIARAARGMASALDAMSVGPVAEYLGPAARAIRKAAAQEDKIGDLMDMFLPFVAECDWVFSCANTRAAMERMPPDERARFIWWPEAIDWRQWMNEVHMPGIERWSNPEFERRLKRELKPLRRYDTLLDLLDEMAERHGHAPALRYLERDGFSRLTYLEWREASASVAARLTAMGVERGDTVLLAGENRVAWPVAYFGILRAGAIAVPIDPQLTAGQIERVVESSQARVALWGAEVLAKGGAEAKARLPRLEVCDLDAIVASESTIAPPPLSLASSDLASIIYTSGTTGDPKGVALTHDNFTSLLAALTPLFPLEASDGVLSVLPLHHTFEFSCGLLLPLSRGACINYLGEITSDRLSEALEKGNIRAMIGVPALWQLLERRVLSEVRERGELQAKIFDWALAFNRMLGRRAGIDGGRLLFGKVHDKLGGRIRFLISGGSALPRSTADTFAGLGLKLSEGYGLTEAAPVLTVAKATPKSRIGQVGPPIPGVEIKIAEPNRDGVGEVLARGPNVMSGYYNNQSATREVIDAEGWLHTGDLGKLDDRGQLVLSGRSKEVILSTSGENIYPDDVEQLLGKVRHVAELAIVGVDRGDGEAVGCIAVAEDEGDDRGAARARAMRSLKEAIEKLPRASRPTVVHLYDADLPKTATRKVKRREVKRILERLAAASVPPRSERATSEGGALATVQHAVAAIAGRRLEDIGADMTLAGDLGFDSLMSMELSVALETQLGRPLDTAELMRVETVRDAARLLGSRAANLTQVIEDVDERPLDIPPIVARTAKTVLGKAQMAFYGQVMKPEIVGRAFIPHNRNSIVISNHSSHLDMGFVKYALGSYGRDVVGLAAADYFFAGRWKRAYFEHLTNLQAFDRKTNLRQALREAGDTLRSGKNVLLFPEGTRSTDGTVHEFKSTLGHLALTTRTDILPMYLRGTHESWPKGRRFPTRRDIKAIIGPPLRIADLERLTQGMRFAVACRAVATMAHAAVVALGRGRALELREYHSLDEITGRRVEHPLVSLFRDLEGRYVTGRVDRPLTYYFSLGAEAEAKWTARLEPERCTMSIGKPGDNADCVLKTSADLFTKMIREHYMPSAVEIMSGQVKSNDVSLLATFQGAFDLP
jgi:long-chain acyl-CoA synthetase